MPIPDHLSAARRIVLSPEIAAVVPSATYDAWAALKAACGQPMARPEILSPHHIIEAPVGPGGTMDFIDHARARVRPRIHAYMRQIGIEPRRNPIGAA